MNTRRVLVALAVVAAMLPAASQAGFVIGGNTNMAELGGPSDPLFEATLNVAIFELSGSDPDDPWGTGSDVVSAFRRGTDGDGVPVPGSGPLAVAQRYLYLYQIANNGPNISDPHSVFRASIDLGVGAGATIGSYGYFKDLGLIDGSGEVGVGNDMGEDAMVFSAGAPVLLTLGPGSVGTIAGGKVPGSNTLGVSTVDLTGDIFGASFSGGIVNGGRSVVFGFTASKLPVFVETFLQDGEQAEGITLAPAGPSETPDVPAPTGLMALASLAMVGVGAAYRRRRVAAKA